MSEQPRSRRRDERIRQVLVELSEQPSGLSWQDAWTLVEAKVPLSGDELNRVSSGATRAESETRWAMVNVDKAGWVLNVSPVMRLTISGRAALQRFADPAELATAATAEYQRWDNLRKQVAADPGESLPGGLRLVGPGERAVLRAADRIFAEGLYRGGSSFAEHVAAWSAASVQRLHAAFVEKPDLGGGAFITKLKGQLDGASDEAILLAAELLALLTLPLSDWKPDTKRQRVKAVLAMMNQPVHIPMDLSAAMEAGVYNGSLAFKTLLWRALTTGIEVASAWWSASAETRDAAWNDPWAWRSLVEDTPGDTIRAARAALCYLRFPGTFQPIISWEDKTAIRSAFADEIPHPTGDVDRDLLALRLSLQERDGGPVDFYDAPYSDRWRLSTPIVEPIADELELTGRAWLVRGSSVRGVDIVPAWLAEGFVSLAASRLPSISEGIDDARLKAAVETGYDGLGYSQREAKFEEVRAFVRRLAPDHLILTTSGSDTYIGRVAGNWQQVASPDERSNLRRPVMWLNPNDPIDTAELPAKLMGKLRSPSDVIDLTDVQDLIGEMVAGISVTPTQLLHHLDEATVDRLLVGRPWLDELVDLLAERRQVILYGPPGTGKTFLAQEVAEALAGSERVTLVQFHPAYSYEGFFEGYRPAPGADGQVSFKLVPGPFRKVVDAARDDPGNPYVLIVDEINRANLAKVFGELYFLLEYRDRTINLLYSSEDTGGFSLPENVYLIGTMNTADRSIALVDAAMRRRFAFLSLHPDDNHLRSVLPRWLADRGLPAEPALLLAELNRRIDDVDFRIGPSYLMRNSVGDPGGLDRIWRTSILPLLEEHHIGDDVNVEARYGLAALRAAIAPPPAASTETTADVDPQE